MHTRTCLCCNGLSRRALFGAALAAVAVPSGAAFAAAMTSPKVFQGASLCAASTSGPVATKLTGANACMSR